MPTFLIGAALLRGEWKTAVSMILDPREGDILYCFSNLLFICLTASNLVDANCFDQLYKI